jgi:hypothetical protein
MISSTVLSVFLILVNFSTTFGWTIRNPPSLNAVNVAVDNLFINSKLNPLLFRVSTPGKAHSQLQNTVYNTELYRKSSFWYDQRVANSTCLPLEEFCLMALNTADKLPEG